jgi:hypothetical protein
MSQADGHGEFNLDDLLQQEFPVRYKGKSYVLREPTEDATLRAQRLYAQDAKLVDGKVTASVGRAAEAQATLVSLCLYDCETNKNVPLGTLWGWESSVVKFLFKKLEGWMKAARVARGEGEEGEEQARLEEERLEEERAKNSPARRGATSSPRGS